ncbi:galactokinase [Fructilactobacillus fructivorans]|uniref:galactokinase n=1 Tax=Fructilactobacillus fructivorans TaxID=1614 RepID=UPI0007050B79|nr:galactokinase [Fructilactobacillus fructivorans]KRN13072.1 galactokinase [Fructilactobacillus fructivorans]
MFVVTKKVISTNKIISDLTSKFKDLYQQKPTKAYFAPGRINLIGEHTDYNGGYVFPCAISLGTYALVTPKTDNQVKIYSTNFSDTGINTFPLDDLNINRDDGWINYPKGMFKAFADKGHQLDHQLDHGFNILIYGNLPDGSGLSSSASIEMLFGKILNDQFGDVFSGPELAKLGQHVENTDIGVNSGIMDQYAVEMGQKNTAILLDTNTMKSDLVPIKLGNYKIVIMNTNKKRGLKDSKYNERRKECEEALALVNKVADFSSFGAMSNDEFDEYTYTINNATLLKRARHAVSENQRTLRAVKALRNNAVDEFGRLMNASHISLEYDYEVTGPNLDTLVHEAWKNGAIGARMTGAGFGGCAIAIVPADQIDRFTKNVGDTYNYRFGYDADFYIANIADGPREIQI